MRYTPEVLSEIKRLVKKENKNSVVARFVIQKFELTNKYDAVWKWVNDIRNEESKILESRGSSGEEKKFVLSAWNDEGYMMDIDQYCDHYKLPRKDVRSYKLVSHTGTPYYNVKFEEHIEALKVTPQQYLEKMELAMKEHFPPVKSFKMGSSGLCGNIGMVNISDLHVGMHPNKDDNSLWDAKWDRDTIISTIMTVINGMSVFKKQNGGFDLLVVNLTGDLVDGFNQETTRGGHKLPQVMSNIEQSDVCVEAILRLVEGLTEELSVPIVVYANSNSNHGGDFEYITLQKLKLHLRYKLGVDMELSNKLALGYIIPGTEKPVVILHGKDKDFQSRPLPAYIDDKDDYKIESIINAVHKERASLKPLVIKGDSHRFVQQNKKNFYWVANSACSPDSDWVKNNFFNAGTGACTVAIYNKITDTVFVGNIEF